METGQNGQTGQIVIKMEVLDGKETAAEIVHNLSMEECNAKELVFKQSHVPQVSKFPVEFWKLLVSFNVVYFK